jgi:hypothetical protein
LVTLRELIKRGPLHGWIGLGLMAVISVQEETVWPVLAFVLLQIGLVVFGIGTDRSTDTPNPPQLP